MTTAQFYTMTFQLFALQCAVLALFTTPDSIERALLYGGFVLCEVGALAHLTAVRTTDPKETPHESA